MLVKISKNWVTKFEIKERTLVIKFPVPRRYISSAVRGGGMGRAHAIINHQVLKTWKLSKNQHTISRGWEDPSRTLGKIATRLGIHGCCVGLMTVVDLNHLVLKREQTAGLWVEGFFTVGVTNAVRVGDPASYPSPTLTPSPPGTINIILVTNANLGRAALVGAVTVATECKTALLLEKRIPSFSGNGLATGTGTDSIVLAIGNGPRLRYSGTHTKIGELIGRVVARGMSEGLTKINLATKNSD